jgi:hypothetical protein
MRAGADSASSPARLRCALGPPTPQLPTPAKPRSLSSLATTRAVTVQALRTGRAGSRLRGARERGARCDTTAAAGAATRVTAPRDTARPHALCNCLCAPTSAGAPRGGQDAGWGKGSQRQPEVCTRALSKYIGSGIARTCARELDAILSDKVSKET